MLHIPQEMKSVWSEGFLAGSSVTIFVLYVAWSYKQWLRAAKKKFGQHPADH
ncbi:MAG: hypothetical protein HYX72_03580 [Acidobacteria bacterium]|nr:hypothetical protein [Acidobacteriota bacterium]